MPGVEYKPPIIGHHVFSDAPLRVWFEYSSRRFVQSILQDKILGCAKLDCNTNYTRLGTKRRKSNSETGIFGFCNQRPDYSRTSK